MMIQSLIMSESPKLNLTLTPEADTYVYICTRYINTHTQRGRETDDRYMWQYEYSQEMTF